MQFLCSVHYFCSKPFLCRNHCTLLSTTSITMNSRVQARCRSLGPTFWVRCFCFGVLFSFARVSRTFRSVFLEFTCWCWRAEKTPTVTIIETSCHPYVHKQKCSIVFGWCADRLQLYRSCSIWINFKSKWSKNAQKNTSFLIDPCVCSREPYAAFSHFRIQFGFDAARSVGTISWRLQWRCSTRSPHWRRVIIERYGCR